MEVMLLKLKKREGHHDTQTRMRVPFIFMHPQKVIKIRGSQSKTFFGHFENCILKLRSSDIVNNRR